MIGVIVTVRFSHFNASFILPQFYTIFEEFLNSVETKFKFQFGKLKHVENYLVNHTTNGLCDIDQVS